MDPKKDAYGQEIWAHFQGKPAFEAIERDDGFIGLSGGTSNYFADYKDWPRIQRTSVRYAKGRVLDVGAGAGRVALYLQKRGLDVTAIDNSPLAIRVCRKRGVKKARVLPIEEISSFKPGYFDSIILFGNNFGLFGNRKKARSLLRAMHRITSQDALIISENADPYDTEDEAHLKYHKLNRKRGRMSGQLRIRVRFRDYIGDWFDYLFVSGSELKEILKGTGWKIQKTIPGDSFTYCAIIGKEQERK